MENKSEYLKKNIIGVGIIASVILIIIIGYKFITREKPTSESWTDAEFGDIVVTPEETETEELPENIFDMYNQEYEFTKLASVGVSTYKPVGWDAFYDNEFFYFTAPEGDENYPHVEIGICVVDIGSINNTYDRAFAQKYMQENIKNHNTTDLSAELFSNNSYTPVKINNEIIGYYSNPDIEFRREDDVSKGGWNPYSVVYLMYIDDDIAAFCCVTGPKMCIDRIDEMAKTVAYNTLKYTNTKFDFAQLLNVPMKKTSIGNVTYMVKDLNVESSETDFYNGAVTGYGGNYMLSTNISSIAYNCRLIVSMGSFEGNLDDYVDRNFMKNTYRSCSQIFQKNETEFERKGLPSPQYKVDSIEAVSIANKDARKVTWHVEVESDSTSRTKVDSIMPKMFTTYVFHDNDTAYSFTVNYTKYQKYAATEYLNKTIETIGFQND